MKIMLRIGREGDVSVLDSEFEPIPGATAEITDSAEGLLWLDVDFEPVEDNCGGE